MQEQRTVYYKINKANYEELKGCVKIVIEAAPIAEKKVELSDVSYVYDGTAKSPNVAIAGMIREELILLFHIAKMWMPEPE
ncbi:MAG: hypothetical protein ACLTJ5_03775 [Clostridium sp.]